MICPEGFWHEANSSRITSKEFVDTMKRYSHLGLTLYVGADSMLYSEYCTFSCIVAVHCNEMNIANYYYQKQKIRNPAYKNLKNKIFKEVETSIETANFLREKIPDANIEVHVDIGDQERNATRYLVDNARGWIIGMGYEIKIKPDSWASSVADWHTK